MNDLPADSTPKGNARLSQLTATESTAHGPSLAERTAVDATRRPGDRITGRYFLEEFLGKGGEGEVWRASDPLTRVSVALKFLPPELVHDQSQRRRITECYNICHQFRHPAICWIKNLEEDDQHGMFLIMEFLEGVNLRDYREVLLERLRVENKIPPRQGLIPVREVTKLLRPIAEGLDYLHDPRSQGSDFEPIVHRDVKPANIKVSLGNGFARLLDHGIAAVIQAEMTRTGTILAQKQAGTPLYMAPEIYRNFEPSAASDRFSFALVVYEFLCGRLPFEHVSFETFKHCLLREPPRKIRGLNKWAMSVLEKALSKSPADRFATCTEFLDELERAADGNLDISVARHYVVRWNQAREDRDDESQASLEGALSNYISIEPEAAEHLCSKASELLDLSGLESLEPESAAKLGRFKGTVLLNGITDLTAELAASLAKSGKRSSKTTLVFDGVKQLTPESAALLSQRLSRTGSTLRLNGIRTLPRDVAEALAAECGELQLDGIEELGDAAAEALAKHGGTLSLKGLVRFTSHTVELLATCRGWQPETLVDLTPELARKLVAARLAPIEGEVAALKRRLLEPELEQLPRLPEDRVLCFPGIRSLSVETARELASFPGRLELTGLHSVSPEVVLELWLHNYALALGSVDDWSASARELLLRRRNLYIGGRRVDDGNSENDLEHIVSLAQDLTSLPESFAEVLADYPGVLVLNSLTSLSDVAAAALAKHQGSLALGGVTSLSDAVAVELGTHKGHLHLNGLTSLSESVAAALAKHQGSLTLDGVTTLSAAVAVELGKHKGLLSLDGLVALSDDAAAEFGKHFGDLYFDGLTRLSNKTAAALGKHPRGLLSLNGLQDISAPTACGFISHSGLLYLEGLICLSDEAVAALKDVQGGLVLTGLKSISDKAAIELGKRRGDLYLDGLTNLSEPAAAALAEHVGALYLNGLTNLSDRAAVALSKHQGELWLEGLTSLSDVALAALSKHPKLITAEELGDRLDQVEG